MKQLQQIISDHPIRRIKFSHDCSCFLAISHHNVTSYLLDGTTHGTPIGSLGFFDAAYVGADSIVASTLLQEHLPGALTLYDLNNGRLIRRIITTDIRSLCVDPNRGRILAGSLYGYGGYVETYDFALKRLSQFESKEMPLEMVISHSGNHVAVASVFFELWDTVGDPSPRFQDYPPGGNRGAGYIGEVNAVDITPDGRYALGGLYGGKSACFIVDVATGGITGWYGPDGTVKFLDTATAAISHDGKYVAIAMRDTTTFEVAMVEIYRVSDNTLFYQFEAEKCQTIAFSPVGNVLALGGGNFVSLWQFSV